MRHRSVAFHFDLVLLLLMFNFMGVTNTAKCQR